MRLSLGRAFRDGAQASVARCMDRAAAGQSFDGQPLAPLADGSRAGPSIVERLGRSDVELRADGFRVRNEDQRVVFFNDGTARQPARPVVGLDPDLVPAINRGVAREVAAQVTRAMRS